MKRDLGIATSMQVNRVFPAHGKSNNPFGWPLYHLEPSVIKVYAQGIRSILNGELVGQPYTCFLEGGLCAKFPVGGMVYNPERMG